MMDLKDLELVTELNHELARADAVLAAAEAMPGPTVPARAMVMGRGAGREYMVELLPVDKGVAVSAAQRWRSKIVAQLQSLGVTVS